MSSSTKVYIRVVVGFVHRVVYATLIAVATWALAILPPVADSRLMTLIVKVLDFPVAAAGLLLPLRFRGIDLFFTREGLGALPEQILIAHVRLAVPVYVVLFYVPNLIGAGIGLIRRRRATLMRPTGEASDSERNAEALRSA